MLKRFTQRCNCLMASLIGAIIGVSIGLVVFAAVFMTQLKATNTTTWSTGEVSLWNVLGIVGIAGLLYVVLRAMGVES